MCGFLRGGFLSKRASFKCSRWVMRCNTSYGTKLYFLFVPVENSDSGTGKKEKEKKNRKGKDKENGSMSSSETPPPPPPPSEISPPHAVVSARLMGVVGTKVVYSVTFG